MSMNTILEKITVDEKYIEDGLCDEEFQETMTRIKIIELKAELETKHVLLEALIREKQQVDHERERDE